MNLILFETWTQLLLQLRNEEEMSFKDLMNLVCGHGYAFRLSCSIYLGVYSVQLRGLARFSPTARR